MDPLYAAIATKIIEFAGLEQRVTVVVGTVSTRLQSLQSQYGVRAIDLLFIDHEKTQYLPDLKLIEQSGLLRAGSVIVGDNILYPGSPDFRAYLAGVDGRVYRTVEHDTVLEYGGGGRPKQDIVTVSTKL